MFVYRIYLLPLALGLAIAGSAVAAPHEATHAVQQRTGVIQKKAGDDILLRKRPGRTKYGNITLERGYVPAGRISQWRKTLRPPQQGKRFQRHRHRIQGAALTHEIQKLDLLLQRWQRSVEAFERLRARRQAIRKRGQRTLKFDRRLEARIKDMERQAQAVRDQAERLRSRFQDANKKANQRTETLSRIMKTLQELRMLGAASRSGL